MWRQPNAPLQVETLKLGWCKVGGGDGAKALADLLMYNTSLRLVDLRGNAFGNDGALPQHAFATIGCDGGTCAECRWPCWRCCCHNCLPTHANKKLQGPLTRGSIAGSPAWPPSERPAGAIYISRALKEHTNDKLRELDLGYNEIKDEGACQVGTQLPPELQARLAAPPAAPALTDACPQCSWVRPVISAALHTGPCWCADAS